MKALVTGATGFVGAAVARALAAAGWRVRVLVRASSDRGNLQSLAVDVVDYAEHAMSAGHEASAAAYVELTDGARSVRWGVGIDHSILSASLKAVVSAINNDSTRRAPAHTPVRVPVVPRTPSGGP